MNSKRCVDCANPFSSGLAKIEWRSKQISVELDSRCPGCHGKWLERLGAQCANCGGPIAQNSQVSVMIGPDGQRQVAHSTYNCSPPGGAFYGFWGAGELVSSFENIEQC